MAQETVWFEDNIARLESEFAWLHAIMEFRFSQFWGTETSYDEVWEIEAPDIEEDGPFSSFIVGYQLSPPERLVLALALAPHLRPGLLDGFLGTYPDKSNVTEFGGYRGHVHKGFQPTVETALFLLAGKDLRARIVYRNLFTSQNELVRDNWLRVERLHEIEPQSSALIMPSRELVDFLTTADMGEPEFGPSFPAQKIETNRSWEDLILPTDTKAEIQDIISWVSHEEQVMKGWKLNEKLNPGFRCLFHGPPGTGKTFTATLLGKATGRDVYRIDLSMVVSKYIGETEKNLKVVFDKAQSRGWILFFDEADELFGKRTDVSDSKDRYANQEVSYLLQRVENFDGVVILATNNRENMDKAFTRRFQVIVNFAVPSAPERLKIWENSLPETCELSSGVNLLAIADRYELTGGSIMNVVRHCALRAATRGQAKIEDFDIVEGIRKEYRKAGRILN